ncbi:MAG: DUF3995 domain-containing protein [Ktedonobacteraceae bacterium]|nr:DUF3995 domain-containing protein [Ktedonobacteraceae bacterium]
MAKQPGTGETAWAADVRRAQRIAYMACGWALLFAALSFFWGAGGRTGLHPLEQPATASNLLWVVINLAAGILKIVGGLIALALVRTWKQRFIHRLLLIFTWLMGVGMCLYAGLGLVSDVLHVTGIINDPATWRWFFWYLVLWDPWWLLGGVLYVALAWITTLSARSRKP